jgi:transposase
VLHARVVPTTFMMGITLDTELKPGNRKGRPNYPVEFKRRLATAACEAGVSVSKLAMANTVNANMVFKWRRELRAGLFDDAPVAVTELLPVVLAAAPVEVVSDVVTAQPSSGEALAMIEIVIADAVVRVHGSADAVMLATIFQSLRA